MDMRVSLPKVFFWSVVAVFVNFSYYLGFLQTLHLIMWMLIVSTYILLAGVSLVAVVLSVCAGTSSVSAEVKYRWEYPGPRGGQWLDSTVISFVCAVVGVIAGGASAAFAVYANLEFPLAAILSFSTFLPNFWMPYLCCHVLSVILGGMHFADKKYQVIAKLRRAARKSVHW